MARKKDKIEVEIEAGGRELEIEIDPETGEMTVEEDSDTEDDESSDNDEASTPPKKRGRLLMGLVLGGLAGAASASAIARQLAGAPSNGAQEPQDGSEAASGGLLGSFRSRWRQATQEGRVAAREAEKQALARYRELTGDGPK